ncbi:hypothetical protein HON22_03815 [Candidatus Peregrinibacteria bacterium]|jgi:DNA-binding LytR/AlgR family response regulator|nr:hypothetical protein [Candidatus Peregrinibacteria bacterium]
MPQENPEQLDINELYKTCIAKFDQYEIKLSRLNFSKSNTNLEKEKRRITAFKKVIESYANSNGLESHTPNYSLLLSKVLKKINHRLYTCISLNALDYNKYNFALNDIAYIVTSHRCEVFSQYLKYLQTEYPNRFNKELFFMKNQAMSIQKTSEREKLEKKIQKLEEVISTFSQEIHSIKNINNILQLRKKNG